MWPPVIAQVKAYSPPLELASHEWIALIASCVGGFVTLVYWLVRLSFKRQQEITDRYFSHLERKDQEQQENIKIFGDSMERIGKAMDEQTVILKGLHEKTDAARCRFPEGHHS
jgi:hypothetical protein